MASIYKLYDRNYDLLDKLLVYGIDFKDNHVEDSLPDADSTLTFECLGGFVPEEIEVEGYVETEEQIYVIKEISGTTVTCKLDLEELEAYVIDMFTAAQQPIVTAAEAVLDRTGWTIESTIEGDKIRSVQQFKKTPFELLIKIRDAWMCEIWFDTKRKIVHFADEFGTDKGVFFIDGLNLKSARRVVDGYDYATQLYPIGKDGLTIASVNDGILYVENHQYSNKNIMLIWEDSSYEDPQALKDDAEAKLEDMSKPKISYSAEVRDLQRVNKSNIDYLEDELGVRLQDELGLDLTDEGEYTIFMLGLGDRVQLISKINHIRDRQRIVKAITYPDDPERNSIEMANTVLTWEEYQDKLKAAADAWDDISNADGSVNGVYVHGVQAGEIVGIEVVIDGVPTISNYNLSNIEINGTPSSLISLLNQSAAEHEEETGPDVGLYKLRAKVIDVDDLFAQNINATGTISGAKLTGTRLETESTSTGNWEIDGNVMSCKWGAEQSSSYNEFETRLTGGGSEEIQTIYHNQGDVTPWEERRGLASSTGYEIRRRVYNQDGTINSDSYSSIAPTAIRENSVFLSNKYAPISNSDPILKKNIAKSKLDALDLIKRIPLHAFDWKKDGKHWDVGFIAPELHEIDPNLADPPTGESGSYWSVDSFYLIGVLTKAVQELTERVEALEGELRDRRAK